MGHSLIKEYVFLMLRVLSDTDFSILNRISSRVTSVNFLQAVITGSQRQHDRLLNDSLVPWSMSIAGGGRVGGWRVQ